MVARTRLAYALGCLIVLLAPLGLLTPQMVTQAAPPPNFPFALADGPRPTVTLSVTSGYVGQPVTVSGQGVAEYSGVRIGWALDDVTLTLAEAALSGDGSYEATIAVPSNIPAGPTKVCAAVNGAAAASFTCADFTITDPPPAQISGRIPLSANGVQSAIAPAQISAELRLLDAAGITVASAPIGVDGSFNLPGVPPGTYRYGVSGSVPIALESGFIEAISGPSPITIKARDRAEVGICPFISALSSPTIISGSPSRRSFEPKIVGTGTPIQLDRSLISPTPFRQSDVNLGVYISGVDLNVTFEAFPQAASGQTITSVEWSIDPPGPAPEFVIGSATAPPYAITYNVKNLPPGRSLIAAKPIIPGENCPALGVRDIDVIADPMRDPMIQEGSGRTRWNAAASWYDFAGIIPTVRFGGRQLLPVEFNTPPLPHLGIIKNSLSAGIRVNGSMSLDGTMRIRMIKLATQTTLLNRSILNQDEPIAQHSPEQLVFPIGDVNKTALKLGPKTLVDFYTETPVYSGPSITFFGVVSVKAHARVGLGGTLIFEATLRPLRPALEARMTANGKTSLVLGVSLDLLMGVAEAGADARLSAGLALPLVFSVEGTPDIGFEDPCFAVKFSVRAWYSALWGLKGGDETKVLINQPCSNIDLPLRAAQQDALPPPPRVIAAPAIAASLNGRMLSAYVEDTAPTTDQGSPRILARLSDPTTGEWGPPIAISDPTHTVQSPAVAFVGPETTPVVVWTENMLSQAEGEALGDDLALHLPNQELFYATYADGAWSAPIRLTDDRAADGMPALAGDRAGATLAWVRDLDGDVRTRGDVRIVTTEWERSAGGWSDLTLLNGISGESGYNAQISVARNPNGGPILAWTVDADGDLQTGADRRIAVAQLVNSDWALLNPQPLPPGADSPSIAFIGQTRRLSFLVRPPDGDGVTESVIGTNGELWTAFDNGNGWRATPLRDRANQPIFAEHPQLSVNPANGEGLLLFRRFGEVGTNAELGQLALSRIADEFDAPPSTPLYITNELRQNAQPVLAINSNNGNAMILKVARSLQNPAATTRTSLGATSHTKTFALSQGEQSVESLTLLPDADPALEQLEVSQSGALPGSTVIVTATVRNVGRGRAEGMQVQLFAGQPGSGTPLGSADVPNGLGINQAAPIRFNVTMPEGAFPVYAEVATSGANGSTTNDRAALTLSALESPTSVTATASSAYKRALEVTWLPSTSPNVSGYRILRATEPGGPYAFVGEARGATYNDTLLQAERQYCYTVQAYNTAGILSQPSEAVCTTVVGERVYLPVITR